jgi:hypothetical protein
MFRLFIQAMISLYSNINIIIQSIMPKNVAEGFKYAISVLLLNFMYKGTKSCTRERRSSSLFQKRIT